MLDELIVENLGIIERTRLEPGAGLIAFTGETGAGKTMLLGALRLLAGQPARSEFIGPHGAEARVEGRFLLEGGHERIAERRIGAGRSRAYLDGRMVPAGTLEDHSDGLIEMVAQHEKLALTRPAEVRDLLDGTLTADDRKRLDEYRTAWEQLTALRADQTRLGGDRRSLERELELATYQANEIHQSGFSKGDDERLAAHAARLRHAEELTERLAAAREALAQAGDEAGRALTGLRKSSDLDAGLRELVLHAEGVAAALAELASDVRVAAESLDHDPAELPEIEERLAVLANLRRKYGDTLEEVLGFAETAGRRREELARLLDRAEELSAEVASAEKEVDERGRALREARTKSAARVAEAAIAHLRDLGLPDPVVQFEVGPAAPGPSGADTVGLMFASDSRLDPGPVGRVASGGELSRLVLALRLAGGAGRAPIVAFDEIDAGVGGRTALALGRKLAALADERQVLCVTHLPQVAAFADHHFVVERTANTVTVSEVTGDGRLEELSRMLAGLPDSEQGRSHAEELVALASGAQD